MKYIFVVALVAFNIFACTTMPYHIYELLHIKFEYASMVYIAILFIGNIILMHFIPFIPKKKQLR